MLAAEKGNSEAVDVLVRGGADTERLGQGGVTARSLAEKAGFGEIVLTLDRAKPEAEDAQHSP